MTLGYCLFLYDGIVVVMVLVPLCIAFNMAWCDGCGLVVLWIMLLLVRDAFYGFPIGFFGVLGLRRMMGSRLYTIALFVEWCVLMCVIRCMLILCVGGCCLFFWRCVQSLD